MRVYQGKFGQGKHEGARMIENTMTAGTCDHNPVLD